MRKVIISDVAKNANVSKSTVSQYLNKRYEYMGVDTKRRIEKSIKELGFQANIVARSLKVKQTSTIGVIVANILHDFSTKVIRAIEDACNKENFHIIVCNADDDPVKEKQYIEMLIAKQVDGLIIFPTGGNYELYSEMTEKGFPLVFIDRLVKGLAVDSVLLDNKHAMELAVKHLVDKGHSKIGIVTTSLLRNVTPRVERVSGFVETMNKQGLEVNNEWIKGLEIQEIQNGLKQMLSQNPSPTAIIAGNDLTMMEILRYAVKNNLNIPKDFALIGVDELAFADIFTPSLSTISQPAFKMGNAAATLLLNKINKSNKTEPSIHRFRGELKVGKSTIYSRYSKRVNS
ncbi:substrate-binding domain-containing protein [Siminovitchia sp. 179-K 8D1 HS]|uniref:substrate-binding domain-containing protein n=1 Tax=Siminovitchia sp. 179-K 8D1 HS TaxID=3142385 RepID=UPI00399F2EA8